jgi:hypothetical protein
MVRRAGQAADVPHTVVVESSEGLPAERRTIVLKLRGSLPYRPQYERVVKIDCVAD